MPLQYQLSFLLRNNKIKNKSSTIKIFTVLSQIDKDNQTFETDDENSSLQEIVFSKKFNIGYDFGSIKALTVYLVIGKTEKIELLSTDIQSIMLNGKFESSTKYGTLAIFGEMVPSENENILKFVLRMQCGDLSNAQLHIYRTTEIGEIVVQKYPVSSSDLRIKIDKVDLCQNDDRKLISFKLMKLKKNIMVPILILPFSVVELRKSQTMRVENTKLKAFLEIESFLEQELHTLEMFISKGLTINCAIAIDFTLSNKDKKDTSSLHYRTEGHPSYYEIVIKALSVALDQYDINKQYSVYGFGAYPNVTSSRIGHFFPLHPKIYCNGIDGVLAAYIKALDNVVPSGPTLFEPLIEEYSQLIREMNTVVEYFILVILTDGDMTDVERTKTAISNATNLPLSIIIIGIGEDTVNKFSVLRQIDNTLFVNGKSASRDIVKFVNFSEYKDIMQSDNKLFKEKFASDVFSEVPDQIKDFMGSKRITPARIKSKLRH